MTMLSLATLLSIYPVTLLAPMVLFLREARRPNILVKSLVSFFGSLLVWATLSWSLSGIPAPIGPTAVSRLADFIWYATPLGCNIMIGDLRPNLGLAWYMFVEMFDHFRSFFLGVFQLNLFIYVAPMSIKFRQDPVLLTVFLMAVQSIFKPYPTLIDSVMIVTFLTFCGNGLLKRSVLLRLYPFAMIAFSMLAPINWHYWIHQGSGNANFFYAITLFYNACHICLILDIMYRWFIRDLEKRNPGVSLKDVYHY
jgi:GPI-anchor transamidase subunit U